VKRPYTQKQQPHTKNNCILLLIDIG